jgi:hypothetical protein
MDSNKIGIFRNNYVRYNSVSQTSLLTDPFWYEKITADPHILAQVNIECPDDRYAELKIYISEMASDS